MINTPTGFHKLIIPKTNIQKLLSLSPLDHSRPNTPFHTSISFSTSIHEDSRALHGDFKLVYDIGFGKSWRILWMMMHVVMFIMLDNF
ncbi:hypothetical protein HanXRQr2_Chr03g0088781 [Helianthus annuus]|uniref:Uncharacterized protein n=1 Tax=Helianthus annuus TaxID=4232 RepID=A0A9K3JCT5_HELAN|nr:hypothetical protein HanXRQr2_Chr03g0088781 [Helianthus annuus]